MRRRPLLSFLLVVVAVLVVLFLAWLAAAFGVLKALAVAACLQNVATVRETVQGGARQTLATEDLLAD